MPIRFRCAYCSQLMGISRRKAGTVVRCPKCAGEIIVPGGEEPEPPESPAEQQAGPQAFDDPNIGQVFEQSASVETPAVADFTPRQAPIAAMPPETAPPSLESPPPPKRAGLFIPMGMLVVSLGVIVLLLILMFVIGLIIGRATMIPPERKSAAASYPCRSFSGNVRNPQHSA
ncbi:MAG: hypothetical protein HYX68_08985 [Planctomycetes bacterium]|nr:hypothetical protein [Planctomycetota bacterium]